MFLDLACQYFVEIFWIHIHKKFSFLLVSGFDIRVMLLYEMREVPSFILRRGNVCEEYWCQFFKIFGGIQNSVKVVWAQNFPCGQYFYCQFSLFTCYRSIRLFLLESLSVVCVLLGMFPVHLSYMICWHTIIYHYYIYIFYFYKVSINVPSFICNSSDVSLLSFYLG